MPVIRANNERPRRRARVLCIARLHVVHDRTSFTQALHQMRPLFVDELSLLGWAGSAPVHDDDQLVKGKAGHASEELVHDRRGSKLRWQIYLSE